MINTYWRSARSSSIEALGCGSHACTFQVTTMSMHTHANGGGPLWLKQWLNLL